MMLPVKQSERIVLLDSLRGIAILGILLVNIRGFGLPYEAIADPVVINDTSGKDYYAWFINEWAIDGNFRSLLSMLFGAGMILFLNRIEKKGGEVFFRRQCWLLIFGFINTYLLLWFWDVLYMYAICGMVLYAFRKLSVPGLLIAAAICLLLTDTFETAELYRKKVIIHNGETILRSGNPLTQLNTKQQEDINEYKVLTEATSLQSKQIMAAENIAKTNGSAAALYQLHSQKALAMQSTTFFYFFFWDILAFMFIGIAFYKLGILTGEASINVYWVLCISGLGIGLSLSWLRIKPMIDNSFNEYLIIKNTAIKFYEAARCFRALGFFGFIMLLYKSGWFKWLFALIRPVGQMAFTNYLTQSLLCGFFFYGIGWGMFGKLQRFELYYIVAGTWIIQVLWSHIWLRYFRFGPLEWTWRSLTYWKKQPFRK